MRLAVDYEIENLAVYTDYLLFTLKNETIKTDFVAFLNENIPGVAKYLPQLSTDSVSLYKKMNDITNSIEDNVNNMNVIVGKINVAFDKLFDDVEEFNKQKLTLSGDVFLLPIPQTIDFYQTSFLFYYSDAEDQAHPVFVGKPIENVPNRCMIQISGVSKTDFQKYFLSLSDISITPVSLEETETGYDAYYKFDSTYVLIKFSTDTLSITILGDNVQLVPFIYVN